MKERIVRGVAGSIVLASISLAYFASLNWLWLGVFVGVNLLQSAFTKFCPLEKILTGLGIKNPAGRISGTKGYSDLEGCCPAE
jgi:hypothetical protein